jgi:hypothetical protein
MPLRADSLTSFEMVEVFSRDLTGRVVAYRKPYLDTMCLVEIIIGAGTTILVCTQPGVG